jgi:LysR family nitrogen assimilation transcriptional regulator
MEVRQIELFLRICEHGSINKAAEALRMSQPSLSRWLALLERELGAQLFVRTRQGIRLTDAGEVLADRARPLLRQFQSLKDDIGDKSLRQVNLAAPLSMQRILTAPFTEHVLRDRPDISMRVYEGINNSIRSWMESGLLDAALIVDLERIPENFTAKPLLNESLMLVGNREKELRLDEAVAVADLDGLPIILPGPPNPISGLVENALKRGGHSYNNIFEAEILSLCLELAGRGVGYTVMPYCALHERLEAENLSAAPISDLHIVWKLCINSARVLSVANRTVVDELTSYIAARVDSGTWKFAHQM